MINRRTWLGSLAAALGLSVVKPAVADEGVDEGDLNFDLIDPNELSGMYTENRTITSSRRVPDAKLQIDDLPEMTARQVKIDSEIQIQQIWKGDEILQARVMSMRHSIVLDQVMGQGEATREAITSNKPFKLTITEVPSLSQFVVERAKVSYWCTDCGAEVFWMITDLNLLADRVTRSRTA